MNILDFVKFIPQWLLGLAADIFFDLTGLVMVAIAIPFAKADISVIDGRPILNLPRWAYIWGNDFDGLLGDKRGWWKAHTPFGWDVNSFMAKYWWAAIRNPADNMRMFAMWSAPIIGSTITCLGRPDVADRQGGAGCQFVKLVSAAGKSYYGFYLVWQITATRAFVVRLGYKISPDLQGTKELPKGSTTRINPWENIA